MAKENQLPIYRINREHEELYEAQTFDGVVSKIMDLEFKRLQQKKPDARREDDSYNPKDLVADLDLSGFKVSLWYKARYNPNPWNGFFQEVIQDFRAELQNQNHDFVVFASRDNSPASDIFCFTGGSGFNVISDFADEDFPLQLLVRLIDPEKIKQARSRMLTGSFYARSNYFRGAHSISVAETFGAIWKDITATLKEEIRLDRDFKDLFEGKRDLNCEARSSFKIRRRVSFEEGLALMDKLERLVSRTLTSEEKGILDLFETFQIVRSKPKKDEIKKVVLAQALAYIDGTSNVFDFDVCNRDYENYFEAETYIVRFTNHTLTFLDNPTAIQILDWLRGLGTEKPGSVEALNEVYITGSNSINDNNETKGTFYEHLHGEVVADADERYFLIDKNLYLAKQDFLTRMSEDFSTRVTNGDLLPELPNPSPFIEWGPILEGPYNELYLDEDNFLVADRITQKGIELFDILYFGEDDHLYIVQVKNGFDSCVRDACSQIRNAADVIENSLKDASAQKIREFYRQLNTSNVSYHVRLRAKLAAITEDQFVDMFRNRAQRTYLLLFKSANDVRTSSSNIAKFEVLSTADYMRIHKADFKILNIANI